MTAESNADKGLFNPPDGRLAKRKMLVRLFDVILITVILFVLTAGSMNGTVLTIVIAITLTALMTLITWNREYRRRPLYVRVADMGIELTYRNGSTSTVGWDVMVGVILTVFGGKVVIKKGRPFQVTEQIATSMLAAYEKKVGRPLGTVDRRNAQLSRRGRRKK